MNKEGCFAGRHLIFDIITYDDKLLNNTSYAEEYMYKITEITQMQLVIPVITMKFPFNSELHGFVHKLKKEGTDSPIIKEYTDYVERKEKDDTGVSSIGIWNTSHISTHSWTETKYISIDLFSCADYNPIPVLDYTVKYYKVKLLHGLDIERYMGKPQIVKVIYCAN